MSSYSPGSQSVHNASAKQLFSNAKERWSALTSASVKNGKCLACCTSFGSASVGRIDDIICKTISFKFGSKEENKQNARKDGNKDGKGEHLSEEIILDLGTVYRKLMRSYLKYYT